MKGRGSCGWDSCPRWLAVRYCTVLHRLNVWIGVQVSRRTGPWSDGLSSISSRPRQPGVEEQIVDCPRASLHRSSSSTAPMSRLSNNLASIGRWTCARDQPGTGPTNLRCTLLWKLTRHQPAPEELFHQKTAACKRTIALPSATLDSSHAPPSPFRRYIGPHCTEAKTVAFLCCLVLRPHCILRLHTPDSVWLT